MRAMENVYRHHDVDFYKLESSSGDASFPSNLRWKQKCRKHPDDFATVQKERFSVRSFGHIPSNSKTATSRVWPYTAAPLWLPSPGTEQEQ